MCASHGPPVALPSVLEPHLTPPAPPRTPEGYVLATLVAERARSSFGETLFVGVEVTLGSLLISG